jgi:NDP-sugar pyrophosphorylase family protein
VKPELVVMAAGAGSRFGGLKQLEPVGPNGEKILDYALFDARRAGVERVVFVIRKAFEQAFHQQVGCRYRKWMDVAYAFQELDLLPQGFPLPGARSKPWGTAHAILAARGETRSPFLAINADDFYGRLCFETLTRFLARPARESAHAMAAFTLANTLSEHGTVARAVCTVGPTGLLQALEEHTGLERTADGIGERGPDGAYRRFSGQEPVSMNIWGFHPGIFDQLQEGFARFLAGHGQDPGAEFALPTAVNELIQAGRTKVLVLPTSDPWFGVTYREDKPTVVARIQALIEAGEYPVSLWS